MDLLEVLKVDGLIDFKSLAAKSSIEIYQEHLDSGLEKAKEEFEKVLSTEESEVNFKTVVQRQMDMGGVTGRLYGFVHHLNAVANAPELRKLIEYFQPKYVEFWTKVGMSKDLYNLFVKVRDSEEELNQQQKRALELLIKDMERAGVDLEDEKKKKLQEINMQLAKLSESFSNNVIDSREQFFYQFKSDDSIEDMPKQDLEMAANEAKQRDLEGWVFTLSPPSMIAVMKYCEDREIRKLFYEKSVQVATETDTDNQQVAKDILKLRRDKASILGHENFGNYVLEDRMADSVDQVEEVLNQFYSRAKSKAVRDLEELKSFAGVDDFSSWDVSFYARKLRQEKFDLQEKEMKKYFPLDEVLEGMLGVANELFDLHFKRIETESYHPDVQSYEVYVGEKLIGYFLLDLFARKGKRPGAWCNTLRGGKLKEDGERQLPIVINVSNFGRSNDGPTLLAHMEVVTMFHEFGHAVHMLLSKNDYSNTSSDNVEWDFVELPSQLMENWCWESDSLKRFAKHFEKGEAIPDKMVEKLNSSRTFMSGYNTMRQNQFGFLDIELHKIKPVENVEELNEMTLKIAREYSLLDVPDYYRMYAGFSHIFAGGYAAGYYSYLWAEILEADVFAEFKKKGIFSRELGRRYRDEILSAGAIKPGKELFEQFMGRQPDSEALMQKLGL